MRNIPLRITNVQAACVVLFMWLLGSCTPPPFQFVLSDNYTRERFSGRDIGNHTIGVWNRGRRRVAVLPYVQDHALGRNPKPLGCR